MRIWLIRCVAPDQPGFAFGGEAQLLEPLRGLCDGVLAAINLDEEKWGHGGPGLGQEGLQRLVGGDALPERRPTEVD